MIIVITDHGNKYVNDSSIELLSHDREERKVHIFLADRNASAYDYKDVQQVVYIGNNSDATIKEDSDVVADLKKLLKEEEARYDKQRIGLEKSNAILRAYNRKLYNEAPDLYDKFCEEIHKEFKEYFDEQDKSKPGD